MKKKIAFYVAADVLSKGSAILLVPVVSVALGAANFGILSILQSLIQIFIVFISLSGNGLLPIKYIREGQISAGISHTGFIQMAFLIGMIFIILVPFTLFFENVNFFDYFVVIAVSLFSALSAQCVALNRAAERFVTIAIAVLLGTILTQLGTYIYFTYFTGSIISRLIFLLLGFVIQLIIMTIFNRNILRKVFTKLPYEVYRENVEYGVTLLPHHISYWLRAFADRIIVVMLFGTVVGGNYSLAATIAGAASMGFSVLSQALQPYFYKNIKNTNGIAHLKIIFRLAPIFFFSCLLFGAFGYYFWNDIFGQEYKSARLLFILILVPTFLHILYVFSSHALFYFKLNKKISSISILSTAIYLISIALFYSVYQNEVVIIYSAIFATSFQVFRTTYLVYTETNKGSIN